MAVTAFLAFGSNQGDRVDLCARAVTLLGLLPQSRLVAVSSLYETEPIVDEHSNPGTGWFLNGVVQIETELSLRRVWEICREIERALGRDEARRGGPRSMDLDVLSYDSEIVETADLIVPHPRLHTRRFVLVPLVELAPDWRHPVSGRTARELLDSLTDSSVVRRLEPQPASRYGAKPACTGSRPS